MNETLYQMIKKRFSARKFLDEKLKIEEVEAILNEFEDFGTYKIKLREETSCPRGDLCLSYYDDKTKPNALLECGYKLERLDLFLQSKGIGVCWYGFGRVKDKILDGKNYMIMLNLGRIDPSCFRTDSALFNRVSVSEIWEGEFDERVKADVRLAPSACNSQPWLVKSSENEINVYRTVGQSSMLKGSIKEYFNSIDIGIFLCFLELSLEHYGYSFEKSVLSESGLVARYLIKNL